MVLTIAPDSTNAEDASHLHGSNQHTSSSQLHHGEHTEPAECPCKVRRDGRTPDDLFAGVIQPTQQRRTNQRPLLVPAANLTVGRALVKRILNRSLVVGERTKGKHESAFDAAAMTREPVPPSSDFTLTLKLLDNW